MNRRILFGALCLAMTALPAAAAGPVDGEFGAVYWLSDYDGSGVTALSSDSGSPAFRASSWLFDKYGQLERPWEIIISFRNGELEFPKEINYDYSKSNESGTNI